MDRLNLLVCDLDGTVLGDDEALAEFARWYAGARPRFRLVYSSGRFVDSVYDSVSACPLPEPDAVIGGVGTEIYDATVQQRVVAWPPSVLGWNPHVIRAVCETRPQLTLQPVHLLSYHKVSYYGRDLAPEFIDELVAELAALNQRVTIIYSSRRDLDILPADAHKGSAAAFLARQWAIDPEAVIVAGDSGNDAAMFDMGFRGIVVANAQPELRALDGPHVFHATKPYATGVLEGLAYWQQARPSASRARACG